MDDATQRRLHADQLLADLRARGPRSPRMIEAVPPDGMTAKQTRVAMQQLIDEGKAGLDEQLRLAVV